MQSAAGWLAGWYSLGGDWQTERIILSHLFHAFMLLCAKVTLASVQETRILRLVERVANLVQGGKVVLTPGVRSGEHQAFRKKNWYSARTNPHCQILNTDMYE